MFNSLKKKKESFFFLNKSLTFSAISFLAVEIMSIGIDYR